MTSALAAILKPVRGLLIDFDGPICSLFFGISAAHVAQRLLTVATSLGFEPTAQLAISSDPIDILRTVCGQDPEAGAILEQHLTKIEVLAAESALPTPDSGALLGAPGLGPLTGKVIVSNNSTAAVAAYLGHARLLDAVRAVMGRPHGRPDMMKPNPQLVIDAVGVLSLDPEQCILIGDSVTDVVAASSAGVSTIGYANKPGKARKLCEAGAVAIINDIAQLLPHFGVMPMTSQPSEEIIHRLPDEQLP